jgi:hypothetical protein
MSTFVLKPRCPPLTAVSAKMLPYICIVPHGNKVTSDMHQLKRESLSSIGLHWDQTLNTSIAKSQRHLASCYLNNPDAYVSTICLEPDHLVNSKLSSPSKWPGSSEATCKGDKERDMRVLGAMVVLCSIFWLVTMIALKLCIPRINAPIFRS